VNLNLQEHDVRSQLISLSLALIVVAPLTAQEKPSATVTAAIAGTWHFDASHSDSVPANPMELLGSGGRGGPGGAAGAAAAVGGAPTGGASGGGGGGGRRGGGGGAAPAASSTAPQGLPPQGGGGGGGMMNDPKIRTLVREAYPMQVMVITASDFDVTIGDTTGRSTPWHADGKKHQEAQMEGGVIEFSSKWKGKTLVVERIIPDLVTLHREFKPGKEANTLELKTEVESNGHVVEKKFVYTRSESAVKP
jgi:hypothetical protein